MSRPKSVERLIENFARLPGVGPKTSERLTYFLLRSDPNVARSLVEAIETARASTRVCSQCFNLDESDPCTVCSDASRDRGLMLVVEDPRDVSAFEESGFRGIYHVLQGRVSSLEGIGLGDLTLSALHRRLAAEVPREIVLATNPDLEGEGTAQLLLEQLASYGASITRIARGIPAGATITQVSKSILADAIDGRRPLA
ncbi:MAG: recombination protein RecR [Planctomycetes bacterium]|nr:recombination protein RecR [Planctomycetota bacterium]